MHKQLNQTVPSNFKQTMLAEPQGFSGLPHYAAAAAAVVWDIGRRHSSGSWVCPLVQHAPSIAAQCAHMHQIVHVG